MQRPQFYVHECGQRKESEQQIGSIYGQFSAPLGRVPRRQNDRPPKLPNLSFEQAGHVIHPQFKQVGQRAHPRRSAEFLW